jgi:hypothetical protein
MQTLKAIVTQENSEVVHKLSLHSTPTLSVIVPNYNHAHFLQRCLGNLLGQSVPVEEIIVIDDGSTDNSREVLASLAGQYTNLRVYYNERNFGVNETVNRGITLAKGDYIFFAAADDEVRLNFFEKLLPLMRAYPNAGLYTGLCRWRRVDSGFSWIMGDKMPKEPCYLSPQDMMKLSQRRHLMISNSSTIYRKTALIEIGGWIPELKWFADWFGSATIGFRYGMCHVYEELSSFNLSPTSYYHSARSQERHDAMRLIIQLLLDEKFADVLPRIIASGALGEFGWPMLRLLAGRGERMTAPFIKQVIWREAKAAGNRYFPNWLARICIKKLFTQ